MLTNSRLDMVLIPWDPESPEQVERLYQQRVACGWYENDVESWRDRQRSGAIALQWMVLGDLYPSKEGKLSEHAKIWPLEARPLSDTATSLGGISRTADPTRRFLPVGHISLNADGEDFVLEGSYKIAYFYVSTALQGGGLGRAAMDAVESMAASQPLCAKLLWLSTTSNVQQDPPPAADKASMSTQSWYARRGYDVFQDVPRKWQRLDSDGVVRWTDAVYMRKYIT